MEPAGSTDVSNGHLHNTATEPKFLCCVTCPTQQQQQPNLQDACSPSSQKCSSIVDNPAVDTVESRVVLIPGFKPAAASSQSLQLLATQIRIGTKKYKPVTMVSFGMDGIRFSLEGHRQTPIVLSRRSLQKCKVNFNSTSFPAMFIFLTISCVSRIRCLLGLSISDFDAIDSVESKRCISIFPAFDIDGRSWVPAGMDRVRSYFEALGHGGCRTSNILEEISDDQVIDLFSCWTMSSALSSAPTAGSTESSAAVCIDGAFADSPTEENGEQDELAPAFHVQPDQPLASALHVPPEQASAMAPALHVLPDQAPVPALHVQPDQPSASALHVPPDQGSAMAPALHVLQDQAPVPALHVPLAQDCQQLKQNSGEDDGISYSLMSDSRPQKDMGTVCEKTVLSCSRVRIGSLVARCISKIRIRAYAEPIQANAEPILADAEPIQANAKPIRADAEPIRANADPIRADLHYGLFFTIDTGRGTRKQSLAILPDDLVSCQVCTVSNIMVVFALLHNAGADKIREELHLQCTTFDSRFDPIGTAVSRRYALFVLINVTSQQQEAFKQLNRSASSPSMFEFIDTTRGLNILAQIKLNSTDPNVILPFLRSTQMARPFAFEQLACDVVQDNVPSFSRVGVSMPFLKRAPDALANRWTSVPRDGTTPLLSRRVADTPAIPVRSAPVDGTTPPFSQIPQVALDKEAMSPVHGTKRSADEDDDELIIVKQEPGMKCPYTQRQMKSPIRNLICGHNYEREAILQYIKHRRNKAKCPFAGCPNLVPLRMDILVDNRKLRSYIEQSKRAKNS